MLSVVKKNQFYFCIFLIETIMQRIEALAENKRHARFDALFDIIVNKYGLDLARWGHMDPDLQ